jgi:acetylornithine deacetylase/succinyl-diaminopimelate desuccinylase-like protein
MLAAHLDTVPAGDPVLWTVPPFAKLRRDDRIYGRGTNDDKHALAIMVFLAEALQDLGIRLKNHLYFTGYVDEEFGGGNGALAACIQYPCDFYVNMDCQDMQIWNCATGGQRLAIFLSHPQPQNSCGRILDGLYLCKARIDTFGQLRKSELAANPLYQDSGIPADALRYMAISSGLNTNDKHKGMIDFAFYTDRSREEIQTELDDLFDHIRRDIAPLGLEVEKVIYRSRFFPYGYTDASHPEIRRLQRTCRQAIHQDATVTPSCLSDLSLFLSCAPGKAVSFGGGKAFNVPGGAHLPDEFIECDQLVDIAKAIGNYILDWDEELC